MRRFLSLAVVAAAVVSSPVHALEKRSARVLERSDDWNASSTTSISYYNICTGWVWLWSGWAPGTQAGTSFSAPSFAILNTSFALTFSGAPSGYGFTGTIAVTDPACGAVLAAQPYLPPTSATWSGTAWGGLFPGGDFDITITWQAPTGLTNTTGLASDHPAAGPTGPQACGTCYATSRTSRSRTYGVGGTYCPAGNPANDGICDVEFLISAGVKAVDILVDDSWGSVKNLYR